MVWLALEAAFLFVAVPLLFHFRFLPNLPIPGLLAATIVAYVWLRRTPGFDSRQLWNAPGMSGYIGAMLLRAGSICAVLGWAVYQFAPELLFDLPRTHPVNWLLVMLLYPVISVYAQEVFFRAFFFRRYLPLFGGTARVVLASAFAFGFAHIVFGNWLAVVLSFGGGILFASSYARSGSLLLASIEHAIYGNFIFTIGLGQFFYHGAAR